MRQAFYRAALRELVWILPKHLPTTIPPKLISVAPLIEKVSFSKPNSLLLPPSQAKLRSVLAISSFDLAFALVQIPLVLASSSNFPLSLLLMALESLLYVENLHC